MVVEQNELKAFYVKGSTAFFLRTQTVECNLSEISNHSFSCQHVEHNPFEYDVQIFLYLYYIGGDVYQVNSYLDAKNTVDIESKKQIIAANKEFNIFTISVNRFGVKCIFCPPRTQQY